jgi:hypothetical protein
MRGNGVESIHGKNAASPTSNRDKRRAVEAALRANPGKSNREIARETQTTHPFVARMRRNYGIYLGIGLVQLLVDFSIVFYFSAKKSHKSRDGSLAFESCSSHRTVH